MKGNRLVRKNRRFYMLTFFYFFTLAQRELIRIECAAARIFCVHLTGSTLRLILHLGLRLTFHDVPSVHLCFTAELMALRLNLLNPFLASTQTKACGS